MADVIVVGRYSPSSSGSGARILIEGSSRRRRQEPNGSCANITPATILAPPRKQNNRAQRKSGRYGSSRLLCFHSVTKARRWMRPDSVLFFLLLVQVDAKRSSLLCSRATAQPQGWVIRPFGHAPTSYVVTKGQRWMRPDSVLFFLLLVQVDSSSSLLWSHVMKTHRSD